MQKGGGFAKIYSVILKNSLQNGVLYYSNFMNKIILLKGIGLLWNIISGTIIYNELYTSDHIN